MLRSAQISPAKAGATQENLVGAAQENLIGSEDRMQAINKIQQWIERERGQC